VEPFLRLVTGIGAATALVFWALTLIWVWPLFRRTSILHIQTIVVGTVAWIGLDALLLLSITRTADTRWLGLAFGFVMGFQVIASVSAFLFARKGGGKPPASR